MDERQHHAVDAGPEQLTVAETILLSGGMVLFLAMLFEMREPLRGGGFVGPPLLAAAGALILWRIYHHRVVRTILLSGAGLLILWLLVQVSTILIPFVAAFLLAYLFNPLGIWLHRRLGISRVVSAFVVTLVVVGIITLLILELVPSLLSEIETIIARLLEALDYLQTWLQTTPLFDRLAVMTSIDVNQLSEQLTASLRESALSISRNLPALLQRIIGHVEYVFALITILAMMPVLIFYMLKDYSEIKRQLEVLFPTFGGQRDYLIQAGEVVGSYMRAQLTLCVVAAINVWLLLMVFGIPFALLIGILAGLFNFIPNIGALITAVIGVLIALIFGDPWLLDAIIVLLVLTGQNLFEQSVLMPRIMSAQLGMHPVLVLLSLFVFAYVFGLLGLIIAVPTTALLVALYQFYRDELALDLAPEAQLKRDLAHRLRGQRAKATGGEDTNGPKATGGEDTNGPKGSQ